MKVPSRKHIYRYVPNFLNNRKLPAEEQIVIRLRVISSPEDDAYQRDAVNNSRKFAPDKAQELNEARFNAMVTEKLDGIEGLEIDGMEGKTLDYETFYAEAPPEIVSEVIRAIRSTELLTLGEQKNFVPESGTSSPAPADI